MDDLGIGPTIAPPRLVVEAAEEAVELDESEGDERLEKNDEELVDGILIVEDELLYGKLVLICALTNTDDRLSTRAATSIRNIK